jgi:hypothetical protein
MSYKQTTLIAIPEACHRKCILAQLGNQSWLTETDEGIQVTCGEDVDIYRDRITHVWQLRKAFCHECHAQRATQDAPPGSRSHLSVVREAM